MRKLTERELGDLHDQTNEGRELNRLQQDFRHAYVQLKAVISGGGGIEYTSDPEKLCSIGLLLQECADAVEKNAAGVELSVRESLLIEALNRNKAKRRH